MRHHTYFSIGTIISLLLVLDRINAESEKNVSAKLIQANPYFVAIEEGKNVTILCSAISPITSCRWHIPGMEPLSLSENDMASDSYEYFGSGLNSGQCGITLFHIKKENGGNASCIVDLNEHLKNIQENIPITITKELPIDNKTRTIIGIILFSILTVIFNIILLICYCQGQSAAKKTKRALTQSHTNPIAPSITASEQVQRIDIERHQQPQSSSSTSPPKN